MSRRETTIANLKSAVEAGLHPGNYPIGYARKTLTNDPAYPNPKSAPAIVVAFKLRVAGYSLVEICKILTVMGLRSSRGKQISRQALRAILKNPFYMGLVQLNHQLYPGVHEPLVSAELFLSAQETLPGLSEPKVLK